MKKLLSSMLILTLSLNSFDANCSAANETSAETSNPTVSEKIKQINDNLAQIKGKTLDETNKENAKEESQSNKKDDSESCENKASGSTKVNAQKNGNKSVKKSFREKQIEKLNKEIQNLEKTSDKKYFWKNFFIRTAKILGFGLILRIIYIVFKYAIKTGVYVGLDKGYKAGYTTGYEAGLYEGLDKGYGAGYETGYEKVNPSINCGTATDPELKAKTVPLLESILKIFHPDHFKIISSFKDIESIYHRAADLLRHIKVSTNFKNFTDEINKPYTEPNISNVHYLK